jgi:hypothetical protein
MQWALTYMQSCPQKVYVALADQDDIWHGDKLTCTLQIMTAAESGQVPVLVQVGEVVVGEEDLGLVGRLGQVNCVEYLHCCFRHCCKRLTVVMMRNVFC